MREDPIVKETRLARAKLFAECDQNLDKLMDRLKASEEHDKSRVVSIEALRSRRQVEGPSHLTTG